MDTTILVIEDEQNIANLVRIALEREGFQAVMVRTGEEGLCELERRAVALAILDIGLPGIDGFEVCRRIRKRSNLPVIILTARDEELDRVLGLELGADDYVPKPFSPRELIARIRAVLRRAQPPQPASGPLRLGDLVLLQPEHEVKLGGEVVNLTPMEFELLTCLLESPGIVLSRERLLERVWGFDFPGGTRTVDQHVAQLRAKLGRPELIETVRGIGYKVARE